MALTEKANALLMKERPGIEKRLSALRRSLKATAGESGTLAKALVKASGEGATAINEELAKAGARRREIEDAMTEAEQRLAELERAKASAESVQVGLSNFKRVFAHLQPHEQRELVRLVLKQATVGDRELVLELYGGALGAFEGQKKSEPGSRFAEPPIWLRVPGQIPNFSARRGHAQGRLRQETPGRGETALLLVGRAAAT